MSHFKTTALKTALTTLLAFGALAPLSAQAAEPAPAATVEVTLIEKSHMLYERSVDMAETSQQWTRDKRDSASTAWKNLGVKHKVQEIQSDFRPLGDTIKSSVSGVSMPGKKAAIWTDRKMSLPAILLILVFGGAFAFLTFASPESRTGGHH